MTVIHTDTILEADEEPQPFVSDPKILADLRHGRCCRAILSKAVRNPNGPSMAGNDLSEFVIEAHQQ